jgi:thioredoxin-dependent peroxiredoxin
MRITICKVITTKGPVRHRCDFLNSTNSRLTAAARDAVRSIEAQLAFLPVKRSKMKTRRRYDMPLLLLVPALFVSAGVAIPASDLPTVGTAAPGFTLDSQEGAHVSLSEFRGKWVVLYFYPKDMTAACTIEAHNFQRDLAIYDKRNAVIVGISVDSLESHQQFCTKQSLTFRLLSDPDHSVTSAYGSLTHVGETVMAARNTFLVDPNGVVRKIYTKVNPGRHSDDVLAALTDLQQDN